MEPRRETREEREARHARKAATVQAHRSKIKAQLNRQLISEKVKGPTQFPCTLKLDNKCVGGPAPVPPPRPPLPLSCHVCDIVWQTA